MKKNIFFIAVLAMSALSMVSCKKEKENESEKVTIYATMAGSDNGGEKTHLGQSQNNQTPCCWSTGDKIALFSNMDCHEYELTNLTNPTSAAFTGEAFMEPNPAYLGFYPSDARNLMAGLDGEEYYVSFILPSTQNYRAPINGVPTFDEKACPMMAYSLDGVHYQFKQIMGVLKLDLKGVGTVGKIVLKDGNQNSNLWGNTTRFMRSENDTPSVASGTLGNGDNTLTLNCLDSSGKGVKLNENTATSFYFVVPVGTLGDQGKGFSIDVYNETSDESIKVHIDMSHASGDIIRRGVISKLAVSDNIIVAPKDALPGVFTVSAGQDGVQGTSDDKRVFFSKSNLLYAGNSKFRFDSDQTDFSCAYHSYWASHFYWAQNYADAVAQDYPQSNVGSKLFTNVSGFAINGTTGWFTLSADEWNYLLLTRGTDSGLHFARITLTGVNNEVSSTDHKLEGLIIFPDNWEASTYPLTNTDVQIANYTDNYIPLEDWNSVFEPAGCVFLPAAGYRDGSDVQGCRGPGEYWTSTMGSGQEASHFRFYIDSSFGVGPSGSMANKGLAIRLVRVVE